MYYGWKKQQNLKALSLIAMTVVFMPQCFNKCVLIYINEMMRFVYVCVIEREER